MCLFCQIADKKIDAKIVYESNNVMAFLDNDPINEGHTLIIPKKHFLDLDDIPNELLMEIIDVSKKLVTSLKKEYKLDGYSIMQNGGKFNDIGHYHMHVFPRYFSDGFSFISSDKSYEVSDEVAFKIGTNL